MSEYYAKPENVDKFEDLRFYGQFGDLLRKQDESFFVKNLLLREHPPKRILEVGAGTGRITQLLCSAYSNAEIVASDYSPEMLARLQVRAKPSQNKPDVLVANAELLPFSNFEFDVVIASRLLMHLQNWEKGLLEMCRVSNGLILFDFPPKKSIGGWANSLKFKRKLFEGHYNNLPHLEVLQVLYVAGFIPVQVQRQFVLPIPLHLRLSNRRVSVAIEKLLNALGLLKICGAPIFIAAQRAK